MKRDLGVNPFLETLQIWYSEIEVKNGSGSSKRRMDRAESVKWFIDDGVTEVRNGLSLRAKEMLLWVVDNLRRDNDVIFISRSRVMFELQIKSLPTVSNAISELCWKGILAKTKMRGLYYINPVHFFRGSRVSAFPDNAVEYKTVKQRAYEAERDSQTYDEKLPFDK